MSEGGAVMEGSGPSEASTQVAEVSPLSTAIVKISGLATGLAALQSQYKGVIFEVKTPKGMKAAKAARLAIREPRYRLEHVRKDAKRLIEDEAERITEALLEIEQPIHLQITTEETRRETERLAAIEAERVRVDAIQTRIAQDIRGAIDGAHGRKAAEIEVMIRDLVALAIDATFGEFKGQAEGARASTLFRLRALKATALEHEADVERVRLEREDLARQREENDRVEAERKAANDAEAQRLATERAELEALRAAPPELERTTTPPPAPERFADERVSSEEEPQGSCNTAAFEAPSAPAAQTRAAPAPQARPEASRPSDAEIIAALAQVFNVSTATVFDWLCDMNLNDEKRAAA